MKNYIEFVPIFYPTEKLFYNAGNIFFNVNLSEIFSTRNIFFFNVNLFQFFFQGILWKHKEWRTDRTETRRSRKLVVSFFTSIANYDYGFYWYFFQVKLKFQFVEFILRMEQLNVKLDLLEF